MLFYLDILFVFTLEVSPLLNLTSESTSGPGPLVGPDELELELIQTQMAQKPKLRAEVNARALRASQNVKRADEVTNNYSASYRYSTYRRK